MPTCMTATGPRSSRRTGPCSDRGSGRLLRLDDLVEPVDRRAGKLLGHAAGPADLDAVDPWAVAEAEVDRLRGLRQVAAGGGHLARHDLLAGVEPDHGPDGVP